MFVESVFELASPTAACTVDVVGLLRLGESSAHKTAVRVHKSKSFDEAVFGSCTAAHAATSARRSCSAPGYR